jgi:hypothetical protein
VSRNSGNRAILDNALASTGVRLNFFYEVNHLTTSLGLVERGLGIFVFPKLATPPGDHPTIVTKSVGEPEIKRHDRHRGAARRQTVPCGAAFSRNAGGELERLAGGNPQRPLVFKSKYQCSPEFGYYSGLFRLDGCSIFLAMEDASGRHPAVHSFSYSAVAENTIGALRA